MKLVIEKEKLDFITDIFDRNIKETAIDVDLVFDKVGVNFNAKDPANVSICKFLIDKQNFKEYKMKKEGEKAKVNVLRLLKALKRCKLTKEKYVVVESDESLLTVTDENKKTFKFPILIEEEHESIMPELEYDNEITVDTKELIESLNDISETGAEEVLFSLKNNGLFLNCNVNNVSAEIKIDFENEIKEELSVKFSLAYLLKAFNKNFEKTTLQIKTDYPMTITQTEKINIWLKYIIAPRVGEE